MTKKESNPARIDVAAFAREAASAEGVERLADLPRLAAEAVPPVPERAVRWSARGESRASEGRPVQPWLQLHADTALPMTCQRCLEPVEVTLDVDRWFRFVRDEATAALEDENAEEDVLALVPEFDLRRLVEDELLLALPVTPKHDRCPVDVRLSAADPAFERAAEETRNNPFAALERLRHPKSGG